MSQVKIAALGIALCLLLLQTSLFSQWNWQSPVPQGNNLLDVQYLDSLEGWAVGEYGTMLHTTTGGVTWYEQEYGRTDNVLAVCMLTPTIGWAAADNGIILYTTDSGDDWNE